MRVFFFVGLRTQKDENKNRCNLGTVDNVVNIEIYHRGVFCFGLFAPGAARIRTTIPKRVTKAPASINTVLKFNVIFQYPSFLTR